MSFRLMLCRRIQILLALVQDGDFEILKDAKNNEFTSEMCASINRNSLTEYKANPRFHIFNQQFYGQCYLFENYNLAERLMLHY